MPSRSLTPAAATGRTGMLGFFQKIPVIYHCPANRLRPQWLQTVVLYVARDSVGGQFGLDSAGLGPEFVTSSCSGR